MEVTLLPFLAKKNQGSGVIVKERQADESQDSSNSELDEIKDVEHCVSEAVKAYKANDMRALARHIKDIHDVLHAYMDEESVSPHSYDAQNEAAADKE